MSGARCPDPHLSSEIKRSLQVRRVALNDHDETAAALARVRAARAVARARQHYTRANFRGCSALLSIVESELATILAAGDREARARALRLLGETNLWLGSCQWADGELERASESFTRSGQLPGGAPDPSLMPPELIQAHRHAATLKRERVTCEFTPPLAPRCLMVDGRHLRAEAGLAVGWHYLSVDDSCRDPRLSEKAGRFSSTRFLATRTRCRIHLPVAALDPPVACASAAEAAAAGFVAEVTRESGSARTVVVSASGGQVTVRLHRDRQAGFQDQIVTRVDSGTGRQRTIGRLLGLVLEGPVRRAPAGRRDPPWYARPWIWTLVGGVTVGVITASVIAWRPAHVTQWRVEVGR
jgi:hypothetical protein